MEIFLFFKLFLILDLIFRFGFVIITNGLWRDVRAGRRSMIGNHVYGNRRTRGSNPLLSATISCRFVGRIFLCSEYLRRSAVKLTGRVCPRKRPRCPRKRPRCSRKRPPAPMPGRTHGSVPTIVPKRTITTIVSVGHGRKNKMNLSARESALGAEKAPSVLANCGVLRMEHFHLLSRGKQSTGC